DSLQAGAETAANLTTGQLKEFSGIDLDPAIKPPSLRLFSIFRNNLTLRSVSFRHAIRLGTVAALSFVLGEVLHVRRGYWVVVTVLVVLKPNFGGTIERVIQRIGGTIVGGLVALLIALWIREREGLFVCVALLAFVSFSVRQFGYDIFTL